MAHVISANQSGKCAKKASVKRLNANFYEIHGNSFVISLSLDENGITDASWNKTKGREHGVLSITQK